MPRLPEPGGDAGSWGDLLNEFLREEHNPDGSLKARAVLSQLDARVQDLAPGSNEVVVGGPIGPLKVAQPMVYVEAQASPQAALDAGAGGVVMFRAGKVYTVTAPLTIAAIRPWI